MPIQNETIDLIITSPPYLNAIDYLRGHKLSLVWMGHSIASLRTRRARNIGTEVSSKLRSSDPMVERVMTQMCLGEPLNNKHRGMLRQYVSDLHTMLRECYRVIVRGGKGVFVIGDCNLRQSFIGNSDSIEILGNEAGF